LTDEEKLKELGLTPDDIEEMREQGSKTAMEFDVKSAWALAQTYISVGEYDKALELLDAANSAADYWSTKIYEVTGRDVYWSEASNRWHDAETGQFVMNPYIDIRVDEYDLDQWLINNYG
jgi:hypothetical protein